MMKNKFINEYILVAVKKTETLKELSKDLNGYITKSKENNKLKIQNNLEGFTFYVENKKGYTKILTKYWQQGKIHVECVASKSKVINGGYVKETLAKKGFLNNGIIILENC